MSYEITLSKNMLVGFLRDAHAMLRTPYTRSCLEAVRNAELPELPRNQVYDVSWIPGGCSVEIYEISCDEKGAETREYLREYTKLMFSEYCGREDKKTELKSCRKKRKRRN